ncbi:MAG: helix-turn-helix domain-containing protein [Alphaproteobacteria bacterium]|nr:helix-turn-helix domain-containing protein [Alphaproteobacteria bacterium]
MTAKDPDSMPHPAEKDADPDRDARAADDAAKPPELAGPAKEIDLAHDRLLYPIEVARLIRRSESSLRRDRSKKRGPAYVKIPGRVLYLESHVRAWLETRKRKSTRD